MYKTYSFKDHRVVAYHPALGFYNLSDGGIGKITVQYSGELASVTPTLDGNAIVNQKHRKDGAVGIEVPQVGDANDFLDRWANYIKNAPSNEFARGELYISDTVSGKSVTCIGVAIQKHADIAYDEESQMRSWQMVCASVEMQ